MENGKKKLRLEEVKVESFVTAFGFIDEDTIRAGGTCDGTCPGDLVCPAGPPENTYQHNGCTKCCPA